MTNPDNLSTAWARWNIYTDDFTPGGPGAEHGAILKLEGGLLLQLDGFQLLKLENE